MKHISLGALLIACLVPATTYACGGFFCNRGPAVQPVDQTAEQIIFAREGDKGVAYIQIRYTGSLPDFGWIIPVRTVPEKIEQSAIAPFNDLGPATSPRFLPPVSSGGGGCYVPSVGCASSAALKADSARFAADAGQVDVVAQGSFGPFNWVTLDSSSAEALYGWLADHNYNADDSAKPIVQTYLDEGALFVALKVAPDTNLTDLTPIKITFPTFDPCIPLRLTAVSAQPDMGVLVYILGDTRAEPSGFGSVVVDDAKIQFNYARTGDPTNYRTLVTQAVKNAGSHAFVTEYAQPTDQLASPTFSQDTKDLLASAKYITRLYTVISPEEMTADPTFTLSEPGRLGDVSNTHQLPSPTTNSAMAPVETVLLVTLLSPILRRRRPRLS